MFSAIILGLLAASSGCMGGGPAKIPEKSIEVPKQGPTTVNTGGGDTQQPQKKAPGGQTAN